MRKPVKVLVTAVLVLLSGCATQTGTCTGVYFTSEANIGPVTKGECTCERVEASTGESGCLYTVWTPDPGM